MGNSCSFTAPPRTGKGKVYGGWGANRSDSIDAAGPMEPEETGSMPASLILSYAWGDELTPAGKFLANFWQGRFPCENLAEDGYERTSPVGAFPPNGYGLVDMIGNTWEWTQDWYSAGHPEEARKARCVPLNPRGGDEQSSYEPLTRQLRIPRKVVKGGSHLCAANYCQCYRPAARYPHPVDTSTSHIGFRCVADGERSGPAPATVLNGEMN
jgi:formylglycine-generating enzyme required for sulfatase activity